MIEQSASVNIKTVWEINMISWAVKMQFPQMPKRNNRPYLDCRIYKFLTGAHITAYIHFDDAFPGKGIPNKQ